MCTSSITLSSLKNEDTGIDISVPRYKEEEAPLGGVSILYEITVLTKLDLFKTRLHKSGDVVHFTVYKAYREIEDLYNKLNKKYPKAGLPPVPKASTVGKYTCEERVEALNTFMSAIARYVEICHSSIFTQFIGINSHRLPSFTLPNSESTDSSELNIDNLAQEIKQSQVQEETLEETDELFPKMKNVSTVQEQPTLTVKNFDLFEEKSSQKDNVISSTTSKGGLFDDFEDDDLFSSKPVEKEEQKVIAEKPKEVKAVSRKPEVPKKKEEVVSSEVDDSEIILQDRKIGEVSLFKEQDLGGFITKDEESLFLVTSPSAKNKKNTLLFSEDEILSPDSDKSLNENLDDLLNLEPLPNAAVSIKKEEVSNIVNTEVPKPQPRPRKKSIDQTDSSNATQKPEVMPRKIFLNKPSIPSKPKQSVPPPIAAKPSSIQSKPPPPPKPKVPAKKPPPTSQGENSTRDLDIINANESQNVNTPDSVVSNLANDLKELDILKYIEQEEKSVDAELNLFD